MADTVNTVFGGRGGEKVVIVVVVRMKRRERDAVGGYVSSPRDKV